MTLNTKVSLSGCFSCTMDEHQIKNCDCSVSLAKKSRLRRQGRCFRRTVKGHSTKDFVATLFVTSDGEGVRQRYAKVTSLARKEELMLVTWRVWECTLQAAVRVIEKKEVLPQTFRSLATTSESLCYFRGGLDYECQIYFIREDVAKKLRSSRRRGRQYERVWTLRPGSTFFQAIHRRHWGSSHLWRYFKSSHE